MKTSSILPTAFLVAALLGAGAVVATAQSQQTDAVEAQTESQGEAPAEAQPRRVHERGERGQHHRGHGGRHGRQMMHQLFAEVDADGDDTLTRAEIEAFRSARVGAADASGDGALSLEEFETLYLAFMRDHVVDSFQELDADGDASISPAEIDARLDRIIDRMDRNGDGAIGPEDRRGRR